MDKIRIFEKERIISFSNRTELIQFVSDYLALQYKRCLEIERAQAMDEWEEQEYYSNKILCNVPKLKKILKVLLRLILIFKKKLNINVDSFVLKFAFKLMLEKSPQNHMPVNVEYEIDDFVFKKIVNSYKIEYK